MRLDDQTMLPGNARPEFLFNRFVELPKETGATDDQRVHNFCRAVRYRVPEARRMMREVRPLAREHEVFVVDGFVAEDLLEDVEEMEAVTEMRQLTLSVDGEIQSVTLEAEA